MNSPTQTTTTQEWGDRALEMARQGESIIKIHKDLGVDWYEVWSHIRKTEGNAWATWQGAKKIATIRMDRLVKEKDQAKREILRREAAECVDYLYKSGRALGRKIDRARKELG